MKKLFYLLILFSQIANCQTDHVNQFNLDYWTQPEQKTFWQKIPQPVKIITVHLTSITLNAISDSWIATDKNRQAAHLLNAGSIGLMMTGPLICDIKKGDWLAYLSSYLCIRVAIFDPVYNVARGEAWNKRWNASYWDLGVNQFSPPPGLEAFGRGIFFTIGIAIPITE